ncbi:MAG: DUF5107 domain-containing protein [Arachnia sp.]
MPRTTLTASTLHVTGSLPGPECTLPCFTAMRTLPSVEIGEGADEAMRERVRSGRLTHPLPYARLSDYDREDEAIELPSFVLSNGILTATVLPTLGGRVWSLFDNSRGRELLFVNPVLRFANFGLTDAWVAGGLEWNLGSTGHTNMSSRPMHAARVATEQGDTLRLWEWERTRDLVLQVDLSLDGDRLLASTRILNPDPEPKPLYYWTNIAVPETAGTRVLASASTAWRTDYRGQLSRVQVPHPDTGEVDVSYPFTARWAADYFFETEPPRFVAAVEPDGLGFAQTSTQGLRGRKLFLWGTGNGGNRWQEWLSGPGARYIEIQAGWCTTQMEHDVIGGHTQRAWTEAFTALDLSPEQISGSFSDASAAAAGTINRSVDPQWLETRHAAWLRDLADREPDEMLHRASGWGAAELVLRPQVAFPHQAIGFPDAPEQELAKALLAADAEALGALDVPPIPPTGKLWRDALAAPALDSDPWVWLARAVAAHADGDNERAEQCYTAAIDAGDHHPRGTLVAAIRGRALLADAAGDPAAAARLWWQALRLDPANRVLTTEAVTSLLDAGHPDEAVAVLDQAPAVVAAHGRLRFLRARALVALGECEAADDILTGLVIPDLAEGGRELTDLWAELHPDRELPRHLDFRMHLGR